MDAIKNSQAIILSYQPHVSKRAVLFDRRYGKIEASFGYKIPSSLVHGALIQYTLSSWRNKYMIDAYEMIALPAKWVVQDVHFFHHLLEVGQLFFMSHQYSPEVYTFFEKIYEEQGTVEHMHHLFLCKLFSLLGIYPSDAHIHHPALFHLISASNDIMLNEQKHRLDQKELKSWLRGCIETHPRGPFLQTVSFLYQAE
jgi:hypothetical protein